jgi:hypothetical protein
MQKYTMTAKCVSVGPVVEIGSKGFKKRVIVLCEGEGEKFPHYLAWELRKDRVNLVNESYVGQTLTVTGYPESRRWEKPGTGEVQYFTGMSAVEVELADDKDVAEPDDGIEATESEDLPF